MADAKISELNALTGANLQGVDLLPIVDSDANNDGTLTDKETKSISITELRKNIISVTDSGGDGSLSYDSAGGTGVITYTGPSASETRAHFSGGTGVDISSGSISIGQSVATNANVQFNQVTAALVGNASTASTLATTRNIALTGAVSGNADFNGGANISISTTLASHTHTVGEITGAAPLASPTFTGTVTVSGNIVPNANETLDIGTASARFRDLYLSGDTLDLGGTKVNKNTDGDIEIKDASNNFKKVKASEIELEDAQDASNKVVIRMDSSGTPELTKVNKTSGAAVETDVKFTTLTVAKNITAGTAPTNANHLTNKTYVDGQISALVDGAPESLNTLNEIALALNDSPAQIDNILTVVGQKLAKASNLSDLANASTARTNLGLGNVTNESKSTMFATPTFSGVVTIGDGTGGNDLVINSQGNFAQRIDFQEAGTSALKITHAPAESVNKLKFLFDNDSANYPNGQLQFTNSGGMNILGGGSISVNTGSISTTYGGMYAGGSGNGGFNITTHAADAQFKKKRTDGGTDYDHAVLNNTSDTTPINVIRRMTQSAYNTLANTSPTSIDDNTLYIIV